MTQVTFMKRKHGLLKKAAELSILCGLKVSLVFSDIQPNSFHVFSNDCAHKVDYEMFLKDNFIKEKSIFHEYSIFDYPFETIGDQDSKVTIEPFSENKDLLPSFPTFMETPVMPEIEKKEMNLRKREPLKSGALKVFSQVPVLLTYDSTEMEKPDLKQPSKDFRKGSGAALCEHPFYRYKFLGLEGISMDQRTEAETFCAELDSKLKSHLNQAESRVQSDEDTILILTAKIFLLKYLGFMSELREQDQMTALLRSLIDVDSMVGSIRALRELIPNGESFNLKLKHFNNLMIGALVNPAGFDVGSLASLRGGKSITAVVSFFVRSLLQQIRLLDAMHSGEKTAIADLASFVNTDNCTHVEQIIAAVFNIVACQRNKGGSLATPLKKPIFQMRSELSAHEGEQSKEAKPLNYFGVPQEKFIERDRRHDVT